jgi:hypothetical protein
MKVPPHQYDATVKFYRDVVGLKELTDHAPAVGFEFGSMRLWIDRVEALSQSEIWLEVLTDNIAHAAERLQASGIIRCDAIERLPENMKAFWVLNPASVVHLVCETGSTW